MEGADTIEAFRGSTVHAALEAFYRHIMNCKVPARDELIADYRARWKSDYHKGVSIPKQDYTAAEYRKAGERWLGWYYDRHHPFSSSVVLDVEKQFMFPLDKNGRYRMKGFADRLDRVADGAFEVHDYKTNHRLPSQEELNRDRQLALYEIGLRQQWREVEKVELKWHFLQKDATLTSTRTKDELAQLRDDTISRISDIEGRDKSEKAFELSESGLCGWCEYQHLCPARKHLFKTKQLPKNKFLKEPGVKLVNRHAALQAKIGGLKMKTEELEAEQVEVQQALVAYASRNNVSQINGGAMVAVVRSESKLSLPSKSGQPDVYAELDTRLRQSKMWPQISTLDRHALLRIAKGEEADPGRVKTMIKSYVTETKETVVRFSKRKDV